MSCGSNIGRLWRVLSLVTALGLFSRAVGAELQPGVRYAFFIVATNGNDKWSGNRPSVNSTATDGPFATLTNALAATRAWKQTVGTSSNALVGIFLRNGVHFLTEPLVLKPQDSGLVLAAYGTERPVISGGRRIAGWKPVTVNGRNAWVAEVRAARNGKWTFHELWVNGQRAVRARYPAHGYLKVAEVPDKTADWLHGNNRFRFQPGELKLWKGITDGEAVVMDLWVESRLPIAGLDEDGRSISFKKRSVTALKQGDLYYLEGALEFLDQPGEWCLDPAGGALYYLPRPGEIMNNVDAIAPVLAQVLRLEGRPENGELVDHVRFKGLTFSHTEWYYPEGFARDTNVVLGIYPIPSAEVGGLGQVAIGVPGAVRGEGVRRCSWKNCVFTHIGNYCLELARGCDQNLISRCVFSDLGAGGPKLGERIVRKRREEQTQNDEISDCQVYDGGRLFQSATGIWLGQTANNRVLHNLVHDFYQTGISIGWTWGYWPSLATNNLVAFNHVHHIGRKSDGDGPIMSDMGAIYTLGMQPGTRILNNLLHDVTALRYGGIGIYLDEGSSSIIVESNVVYRASHGGFHLHYGGTNGVVNNIFAFGRDFQLNRTKTEPHLSLTVMRNIVYFDSGTTIVGAWTPGQCQLDSNLYFDARPGATPDRLTFEGFSLQQWRALGYDQHSLIADPLFRAPRQYDFELSSNSPAFRIGFQPIDLSTAGPRE